MATHGSGEQKMGVNIGIRFNRFLAALAVLAMAGCSAQTASSPETVGSTSQPVWTNGGFESDAIGAQPTGWTIATNINNGITIQSPQTLAGLTLAAGGVNESSVVGGAQESQSDPDVPGVVFPKYGQRALRLNYLNSGANGTNKNVNSASQSMTTTVNDVDASDGKIHVRFALVPILENPGHAFNQQPYYFVQVKNVTKNTIIYQDFNYSAYPGVPWKTAVDTGGTTAYYTDWQLVDVSPGSAQLAIGDQVDLRVIVSGCSLGGHWGRVYLDGLGSSIPGLYAMASGPQSQNAGSNITYTFNYTNGGAGAASGTKLVFTTPANTTFQSASVAGCTGLAAGATGTETCSIGAVAAGAKGSLQITVKINAGTAAGTIVTNGNYEISATGVSPLLGPKVNTTVTSGVTYANLSVTKTDGVAAVGWGQPLTYTIVASNAGPSAVTGANLSDPMPAQLTGVTWTCAGTTGATCAASGSGSINDGTVGIPVNGSVTYTVHASVVAGSGAGTLNNVATVAVPAAAIDPDTSDNAAGDTDSLGTARTLTLTKNGAQGGSVASIPASIVCGTGCAGATGTFLDGSTVILNATPAPGWTFARWTGACATAGSAPTCTLTMSGDQTVGVKFLGPPATVVVSAGGTQSTGVGQPFGTPLSVTVSDVLGDPLAGVTVTYSAPSSGPTASLPSGGSAVTDASGVATLAATANGSPGQYTVTASVSGVAPASFALQNLGAPVSVTIAGGGTQSATVETAFAAPLTVVVRDGAGQLLPNVNVTFTAPSGTGASATLGSATASTNASGSAAVSAAANAVAGSYTVSASVAGVVAPEFNLTNTAAAPASITVASGSPQTAVVASAFSFPLEAFVADGFGNPVPGATVSFAVPVGMATAVLGAPTAVTDASGRASVTASAGTVTGSYLASASTAGVLGSADFALANAPGLPSVLVATSGGGQASLVGSAFGAPLIVTVTDAFGNVVPGVSVGFTPPGAGASATLSAGAVVTDGFGQAHVTGVAGTVAGSYSVVASLGGLTAVFPLTNAPGVPDTVSVQSGSGQTRTVGTAFGAPLVALVQDSFGNAIPNVTVTFQAPASGASAMLSAATATTDATGLASVSASANTSAGAYTVNASVAGVAVPASFSLTNVAGAPASVDVTSGTPQSAVAGSSFGAPLIVVVRDVNGNPVAGAAVTFAAAVAGGAAATLSASTVTTDGSGAASVTAIANVTAGTYVVQASLAGVATPALFSLTNTAGAAMAIQIVSGDGQSATVAQAYGAPLIAVVRDAHGNPVSGVAVTLGVPATGASVSLPPVVVSDASGQVSANAIAGTVAGSFQVTATAAGVSAPAAFALVNTAGVPVSLRVDSTSSGQATTVLTAFSSPLAVTAVDAYGNPAPNVVVAFASPATGAAAVLSAPSTTTDAQGRAQILATANATAGTYAVVATLPGGSVANFLLSNLVGSAAAVRADSGAPASAVVATAFGAPLVALVLDGQGNPIANALVTFTALASGPTASLGSTTARTDASGRASVTVTAGTIAGTYDVLASASGVLQSAVFSLTNTPGAPAALIAASSSSSQSATIGAAFTHPLAAEVVDAYGNPVPGVSVSFSAPNAGATAVLGTSTATSDAQGNVSIPAVAGSVAGTYSVTASLAGVVTGVTFRLTNLSSAPSTIAVRSGSGQSTTVGTAFANPLVAVVQDAHGNPVPNAQVTFTGPAAPGGAAPASATVATDANGVAQLTETAGTLAGTYSVTAAAPGVAAPATFALSNTAGPAASITLGSNSTPQTAQVGTQFGAPLVVTVNDAFGNPVPGAAVQYAAPPGNATASLSTAAPVTDGRGQTSVVATASAVAGAYSVTAIVQGVPTAASFALTNQVGSPSTILVTGGGQTTVATTAFPGAIVLTLVDRLGNPVPNASITVTVPATGASGVVTPASPTTDANGTVTLHVTASAVPGTFTVAFSVPGGSTPATIGLTITTVPTTTTLAASTTAPIEGDPLTLVATVGASIGTPTGSVRFIAGGVVLGTATLTGGRATLTIASPAAGTYGITADYPGAGEFGASTSMIVAISVAPVAPVATPDASDDAGVDAGAPDGAADAARPAGDAATEAGRGADGGKGTSSDEGSVTGGGLSCSAAPGPTDPSPGTALLLGVVGFAAIAGARRSRRR